MAYAWIVVADASKARFYSSSAPKQGLKLETTLVSPDARLKNRDMVSDRPGRSHDRFGPGRHSNEGGRSAKNQVNLKFAHDVADFLKHAQQKDEFGKLYLISDPHFLGLLNKNLDKSVEQSVVAAIDKNLGHQSAEEIRASLPDIL